MRGEAKNIKLDGGSSGWGQVSLDPERAANLGAWLGMEPDADWPMPSRPGSSTIDQPNACLKLPTTDVKILNTSIQAQCASVVSLLTVWPPSSLSRV